jgi:hypothetical protein
MGFAAFERKWIKSACSGLVQIPFFPLRPEKAETMQEQWILPTLIQSRLSASVGIKSYHFYGTSLDFPTQRSWPINLAVSPLEIFETTGERVAKIISRCQLRMASK